MNLHNYHWRVHIGDWLDTRTPIWNGLCFQVPASAEAPRKFIVATCFIIIYTVYCLDTFCFLNLSIHSPKLSPIQLVNRSWPRFGFSRPAADTRFAGSHLSCFQIASLGWWHGWDCLTAWPWFGMIWHKGLWCREWMQQCMEHLFFPIGVLHQTCPLWNSQEFPNKKLGFIQTKYYRNVGWTNVLPCYLCPIFSCTFRRFFYNAFDLGSQNLKNLYQPISYNSTPHIFLISWHIQAF